MADEPATIRFVNGPGIAKARAVPLVAARQMALARAPDPSWRELFDQADTISEGAVRDEGQGRVWYGSTSLILSTLGRGDPALLAALAERDPHVRLRAIRAALHEARSRAPARLGRVACETRVTADVRGVRIDVDVQAPLIEKATTGKLAR